MEIECSAHGILGEYICALVQVQWATKIMTPTSMHFLWEQGS